MEQENAKYGTESMTMIVTMICQNQEKAQNTSVRFLVDPLNTLILAGAELADPQQRKAS